MSLVFYPDCVPTFYGRWTVRCLLCVICTTLYLAERARQPLPHPTTSEERRLQLRAADGRHKWFRSQRRYVKRAVTRQLQPASSSVNGSKVAGERAQPYDVSQIHLTDSHSHTATREVDTTVSNKYTQCRRRRSQPAAKRYDYTCWEREQEQSRTIVRYAARFPGSQSADPPVTFSLYNLIQHIYCSGPRPRAHWYMQ